MVVVCFIFKPLHVLSKKLNTTIPLSFCALIANMLYLDFTFTIQCPILHISYSFALSFPTLSCFSYVMDVEIKLHLHHSIECGFEMWKNHKPKIYLLGDRCQLMSMHPFYYLLVQWMLQHFGSSHNIALPFSFVPLLQTQGEMLANLALNSTCF